MKNNKKLFYHSLTQWLHSLPLLATGLAAGLTADMVKGEEDVVFLMHMDWQLNLYLYTEKVTVLSLIYQHHFYTLYWDLRGNI